MDAINGHGYDTEKNTERKRTGTEMDAMIGHGYDTEKTKERKRTGTEIEQHMDTPLTLGHTD